MLSVHFGNNVYFFLYTDSFVEKKKKKKKKCKLGSSQLVSCYFKPLLKQKQIPQKLFQISFHQYSFYQNQWELVAVYGVCEMSESVVHQHESVCGNLCPNTQW